VKIEEKHLKAVLASAKKIVCYLSILKKSDTKKITHDELKVCKELQTKVDKSYLSTSEDDLTIIYTPAVDKTTCSTLNSTPGDGRWAVKEYGQYRKEWLREIALCPHKEPIKEPIIIIDSSPSAAKDDATTTASCPTGWVQKCETASAKKGDGLRVSEDGKSCTAISSHKQGNIIARATCGPTPTVGVVSNAMYLDKQTLSVSCAYGSPLSCMCESPWTLAKCVVTVNLHHRVVPAPRKSQPLVVGVAILKLELVQRSGRFAFRRDDAHPSLLHQCCKQWKSTSTE
jgi:hypothetical protein